MARYDEDLHENLFFQMLVGKYSSLFNEAADNRWLVSLFRAHPPLRSLLTVLFNILDLCAKI